MSRGFKARAAAVALGLAAGGVVVVGAAPAEAATPSCWTGISAVASNGKIVERTVHGTSIAEQKVSASALPFAAESIVVTPGSKVAGGFVHHYQVFSPGRRPALVDVTNLDASATLSTKVTGYIQTVFGARHIANSGRYYVYGVDAHGNLKRWTRYQDTNGRLFLGSAKVVARSMGGLRTLTWQWSFKTGAGWKDVLYGTTRAGALKQFQIPWKSPGRPKITVLKKSGFAAVTGLSSSWCGASPSFASLIAIDRTHNRAVWWTLRGSLAPKSSNLVNRRLVAPGADWRLHATT